MCSNKLNGGLEPVTGALEGPPGVGWGGVGWGWGVSNIYTSE